MQVVAKKPEAVKIVIQFLHSERGDWIHLNADSPAFSGPWDEISFELEPVIRLTEEQRKAYAPATEAHDAPPIFGMTEEGDPVRLVEDWKKVWSERKHSED